MSERVHVEDWQLLAQISLLFRSLADTFTEQVDIPRGQAMVVCAVARQDGLTQTEIADQLSVQGATITNMLQRMEESNLVVRRRDPDDNRLVRVYLTDAGREKEHAIAEQFNSLEEKIFAGIAPEDRTRLRQLMLHLLRNMGAES